MTNTAPTHVVSLIVLNVTLGTRFVIVVIEYSLELALGVVAHGEFEVILQTILSLFCTLVMVTVSFVAPEIVIPFRVHSYTGAVPPLVGVAVNNADAPEHKFIALVEIETDGVAFFSTVIVNDLFVPRQVL